MPSNASSLQNANRPARPTRRRRWAKRVLLATLLLLPPALVVSHFWPFGIAHYYAMDWALTRDRSEIALINGTLAIKHSRIRGIPQDPRVRGHLAFVGGYRQMFLPADRPIERPWTIAATWNTTPLVGGSMIRAFVVIPLWPVWVVAAIFVARPMLRARGANETGTGE